MRFSKPSDNDLLAELVEHDVVRKGLDGFEKCDGTDLIDLLVLNAEKIDVAVWLEWLTSIRGLLRVARLDPNPDWIAGLSLSPAHRRMLPQEVLLPAFESSGTLICGSLKSDRGWRRHWEESLGKRIVLIAPTPLELRELLKYHR